MGRFVALRYMSEFSYSHSAVVNGPLINTTTVREMRHTLSKDSRLSKTESQTRGTRAPLIVDLVFEFQLAGYGG